MDLSTIGNLGLGFAVSGLVVSGFVAALSMFISRLAWTGTLQRLAERRHGQRWRLVSIFSLLLAGTALAYNVNLFSALSEDAAAVAVVAVAALVALGNILNVAYRDVCVVEAATNPEFAQLARVPFAANRGQQIQQAARSIGLPPLSGPVLVQMLIRAAISVFVAVLARALLVATLH